MSKASSGQASPSQLDKFKVAARELETDDNPERFKAVVKKVGGAKPDNPRAEKRS